MTRAWSLTALAGVVLLAACVTTVPATHRLGHPQRADARLAVSWIGHATMLIQMDDRFILTDPVLVDAIGGGVSYRKVGVPIDPADLPPLDAVLISHMHFDHLSLDSLSKIERKVRRLYAAEGGLVYLTNFSFDAVDLARWETARDRGMEITAVPVNHVGYRYLLDASWMHAFTGYVVRYHGLSVYFPGDTAYAKDAFTETRRRFGHIDLALLPIAPIRPRVMRSLHMDPREALDAFVDLGADRMIPIHFDTFVDSIDSPHQARETLIRLARERGLEDKLTVLDIGQQQVVIPR